MLSALNGRCSQKTPAGEGPVCLGWNKGSCRAKGTVLSRKLGEVPISSLIVSPAKVPLGSKEKKIIIPWLCSSEIGGGEQQNNVAGFYLLWL